MIYVLVIFIAIFIKRKGFSSVSNSGTITDDQLYRLFAEGDAKAFGILLDRYGNKVFGYFFHYFGDNEIAEDLTQETFLRVITAATDFRGDCSFATFLFRIARNLCIDTVRARASRGVTSSLEDQVDDVRPLSEVIKGNSLEPDRKAFSDELQKAIENALGHLPDEQREVFILREIEGLRFREIADILGVNENTVKSRMNYALISLRKALMGFRP